MRAGRRRSHRPGVASLPRALVAVVAVGLAVAGCTSGGAVESQPTPKKTAPSPQSNTASCGNFTIAYDPSNGYEASAFVVGTLAEEKLGCHVTYVKTPTRGAWRLVAKGRADVYLDAYGSPALKKRLTRKGGPLTLVGKNGFHGGVDLMAPEFMQQLGLRSYRDLPDTDRIGWDQTTPAITTVPPLMPLAGSFVDFQKLDYAVRDYSQVGLGGGMGALLHQAAEDNTHKRPNLYLVEAPLQLLGSVSGQESVEIPGSAANDCQATKQATTCSLADFSYQKIANSDFARSDSPAYNLVYRYQVNREQAGELLDIVALSGDHVGAADVASWINTHPNVWRRWLD